MPTFRIVIVFCAAACLGGLASVLFGGMLMAQPGGGALALLWLIATCAIVFGILLVLLAFRVRTFVVQATRS